MSFQPKKKDEKQIYEQKIGIRFQEGQRELTAFLTNFKTSHYKDKQDNEQKSALLCYFQDEQGQIYKLYYSFMPYFYVEFQKGMDKEVHAYLDTKLSKVQSFELVQKVDLEEINHLSGKKKSYFKLSFFTIKDMNNAKIPLKQQVQKRKKKIKNQDNYFTMLQQRGNSMNPNNNRDFQDIADLILDIRQYDVTYHSRVCIDSGLRAGKWFDLKIRNQFIDHVETNKEKQSMPDLKILSYDIETSKDPLKFPDPEKDQVIMISLMYDGWAFLIINLGFCGNAVEEFYYSPSENSQNEYSCHVTVYNQQSQKDTLMRFASFMQSYKPGVVTTFNGDRFDYPFIKARCQANYINFVSELGVNDQGSEYYGNYISHLDCYPWVERDAYLPQGSHGLKAVTKAKLNYDPIEVDPEDMVHIAKNNTQRLAEYAVSDAVATYHLYMKHIHGFIFALSTIIPMFPDEVLRKGSGTLCQSLLMVQAFNRNIIFPNKKMQQFEKFYQGHLLDTQTYTGGRVECLRTGVYRSEFPTQFNLNPNAFNELISNLDEIIKFSLQIQMPEQSIDDISNYQQVIDSIEKPLQKLRDVKNPSKYQAKPLIYHLDVAAMYPNIILTNRLQPVAVVNDRICSGCLFNTPDSDCKRQLQWEWKGQVFPLNEGEYLQVKEKLTPKEGLEKQGTQEYEKRLKQQIKNYCQKIYKKVHISTSEIKTDTVCMKQNSFYVDTVRAFRNRRNQYKRKVKEQRFLKQKANEAQNFIQADQHNKLMLLYESMQLAHKIILNSFYGYVMRKGARWYSMETAAMVTYIGSNIIKDSKDFIEARIGKPLQLDTDGIWLLLPEGFPENVKIKFKNGKTYNLSYPCFILNHLIYRKYMNQQYHTLQNQSTFEYKKTEEMTIFFQIDGPYKAMMIPAAKQKQKTTQLDIQQHATQLLKKRYCVFNFKDQISQFKGFEMKRRGQLRITKLFQQEIFPQYLKGTNLKECYAACAEIATKYINIINKKAQCMNVDQILDYFQESRVLSKDIKDYGESKGVAINSAKRLADFLGPQVIKGKTGLTCYYVISELPANRPVTERAIPTQIFDADPATQRQYLYKWTGNDEFLKREVQIRDILDWNYYFERLSTQIQKMVCIPAVLQNLSNPIEQIQLPEWLKKKTFDMRHHKQAKIDSYGVKILEQKVQVNFDGHKTSTAASLQKQSHPTNPQQVQLSSFASANRAHQNQLKNPHLMTKNFSLFLSAQKRIWKQKKYSNSTSTNHNFDTLRHQQLKSIIHIVPQIVPGTFNIWYHSNGKIQQLLIDVKRRYYCKGTDGYKKAPHDEGEAVQVVIDEEIFLKQQDFYDSILGKRYYETKMPLLTSLIMKKGNIWRVNRQMSTYTQQHIQEVFGEEYLPNIEENFMPIVYLVRCKVKQNRIIWTLINPRIKEYKFIFVDRSVSNNNDELLSLARRAIGKTQTYVSINSYRTDQQAGTVINQILGKYQDSLKQPFLVLLQGESIQRVKSYGVKALQNDLPVMFLGTIDNPLCGFNSNTNDNASNKKPAPGLDILDWKPRYIKKIIAQSDKITPSIVHLLKWSRYSHIPICNLALEASASASTPNSSHNLLDYITNITLTRLLHAGDNLTWWKQYSSDLVLTYESQLYTGRISNHCMIKTYAIEIQVQDFAVNTVVNADQLMKEDREVALMMQQPKSMGSGSSVETFYDTMKSRKAFQYVKKMIKIWIKDVEYFQNDQANELLKNFHKWMVTQNNELYDPSLTRMVTDLMKKTFYRLMGRLNQLGMTIISGSFTKIIVATDKFRYDQALSNINYIMTKCLQDNQKLFKYIKLTPMDPLYKVLLFKDEYNYIGITSNGQQTNYDIRTDIEYVLSPNIAKNFQLILVTFIQKMSAAKDELQLQYKQNKMKLFLQYQRLLDNKMLEYLKGDFMLGFVGIIKKLNHQYAMNLKMRRQQNAIGYDEYQDEDEEQQQKTKKRTTKSSRSVKKMKLLKSNTKINNNNNNNQDNQNKLDNDLVNLNLQQQQENDDYDQDDDFQDQDLDQDQDDSFINDQQDDQDDDDQYMSQHQRRKKKSRKQQKQQKQQRKLDMDWTGENQLDIMVENIFAWLAIDQQYKEVLYEIRKQALRELKEQPSIEKWIIQPIYPVFELPCKNCYHVNTSPGNCAHCQVPMEKSAAQSLQNTVWKMTQQQGRDTYCDRCNRIKMGYLKKCSCGGKWTYREFPLKWIPYTNRKQQQWSFVNEIFDFMGLDNSRVQ